MLAVVGAVVLLVAAAVVTITVVGDDDGEEVEAGPDTGPLEEPEEIWSVPLEGEGLTLVSSDGDRVYVVHDSIQVRTFDASDGEALWDVDLEGIAEGNTVGILDRGQVLVADEEDSAEGEPATTLRDAASGEVLWEAEGSPLFAYSIEADSSGELATAEVVLLVVDDDLAAVDRASGQERWVQDDIVDARLCDGVVVSLSGPLTVTSPSQADDFETRARTVEDGTEVWSAPGIAGRCDGGEVAVSTAGQVVVHDAGTGDAAATIEVDPDALFVSRALPGHVIVEERPIGAGAEPRVSLYPREGGAATWSEVGVDPEPLAGDRVVIQGDDEAVLVRPADGTELGAVTRLIDEECDREVTTTLLITCEADAPVVAAFGLDDGLAPRWTLATGIEVQQVAVRGDRLYVVDAERLAAFA